ncbi:phosphoglycerate dehydrogenase-like enzyme [Kineococcus radiotolerans]|uniref:Phosphoglycerate dehydrogenase-like enzyme n=1 Tax=Kineococcus radiotolerans TaxID=131568 RepID=A0A7W4TR94_KINRA|nr:2-hydroxyacid dehydrogenase [Kineococcus radiotolerans]MBB2903594.1 phosphoglycerate dehydrogenase-like enzyme [Kineococcus radiotolerans]
MEKLDLPHGVEVTTWLPGSPPPADLEHVAFYCGPYRKGPDPIVPHLPHMPALEVVQVLSAGVDAVLPHLPTGTTLCNGRGLHDASTAELAVALVLAAQRGLPDLFVQQSRRNWTAPPPMQELGEQTLLIIGYGGVGTAVERRLSPLVKQVLRVASTARDGVHGPQALPHLLPQADVVVLAVPATARTYHLMDERALALMRTGALLVNVARGEVVDTDALLAETRSGRLRASLDVTDPEPLPVDHPLWVTPGVLITPHVGGGGSGALPRARALVSRQLRHWLAGEPLENVVMTP